MEPLKLIIILQLVILIFIGVAMCFVCLIFIYIISKSNKIKTNIQSSKKEELKEKHK